MARQKNNNQSNWQRPSANTENPFILIPFSRDDLGGYDSRGGKKTEFVVVDQEYRRALADSLSQVRAELEPQLAAYPQTLGAVIFRLREKAIAKSHRPIDLMREAGLVTAGHGRLDEMIVATSAEAFDQLDRVIRRRNTKSIRANLSALIGIEPWARSKKNPEGVEALRRRGAALIRLFRYDSDRATIAARESVCAMLEVLEISFDRMSQRLDQALIRLCNLEEIDPILLDTVLDHPSIRAAVAEPFFVAPTHAASQNSASFSVSIPQPASDLPVVGVFDTGVSAAAASLLPWVLTSDPYVLPPDTDCVHGTAVASLVAVAQHLNSNEPRLPSIGCIVHDVAALESSGQSFAILLYRLRQAISLRRDIKIWNLSLGAPFCCDEQMFSDFAQALDQLSDEFDVLFVVASGNYLGQPRRGWPDATILADRISSPADSVRALTVGSITHLDGAGALVLANSPAPYSRRGPGPVFTPKPDIVHFGGGVHSPWSVGDTSTSVILPDNTLGGNFGTSFAAPVAASMAAHTWAAVDGHPHLVASPHLVKALVIHAAQLSSPDFDPVDRRYFGAGLPRDVLSTLYDHDDSFTLVFEANLVAGAYRWRKSPYPIPACLIQDGKFRGEVIITAAYSPPLNPNAGAEYVRSNVELSFGLLDGDRIKSKVPIEREPGTDTYEKAQIENGGKWSPVKLHRARFPNGISGDTWALQAQCSLRAFEPSLIAPLNVAIVVTLRSIDGDTRVHNDGVRAITLNNWVTQQLPVRVPVTL